MALNDISVKDAQSGAKVPVATETVNTINGVANTTLDRIQLIKPVSGGDGVATFPTADTPFPVGDFSLPFSAINQGAQVIASGGSQAVAQNDARDKIDVMNPGSVRIWLGVGAPAVINSGIFVDPGGCFTEYTQQAIYGITNDGSSGNLTFVEWVSG